MLFALCGQVFANTYYVSTSGDDSLDGMSQARAWRTLSYAGQQAQAGDHIYIQAGDYADDPLVVMNSGTAGSPLVFEGYQLVPGDSPEFGWNYLENRELDAAVMPLLDGQDGTGVGIELASRAYVEVRNMQVRRFSVGLSAWGAQRVLVDNIITAALGDVYADYDGGGFRFGSEAYDNVISNSVVYNAAAEGISITGDRNTVQGCVVVADLDTANAATDYYIVVSGSHNTITGNSIQRVGELEHGGHGMGVKADGNSYEQNLFVDNLAVNLGTAFYVRHRGVQHNTFLNNRVEGGWSGVLIRDGASNNTFDGMHIDGTLSGIAFMDTDEDEGAQNAGQYNLIQNSVLQNISTCAIDFYYYNLPSPASDNTFVNLNIIDSETLACADRENYRNVLYNSIVVGVRTFQDGSEAVNVEVHHSLFWQNGFVLPQGEGNLNADPLFMDGEGGDLHLTHGSPCVDAGAETGAPRHDLDGQPRPMGGGVDLGVFESEWYAETSDVDAPDSQDTDSGGVQELTSPEGCGCTSVSGSGWLYGWLIGLLSLTVPGRRRDPALK